MSIDSVHRFVAALNEIGFTSHFRAKQLRIWIYNNDGSELTYDGNHVLQHSSCVVLQGLTGDHVRMDFWQPMGDPQKL
jgi:hypothetical protein